MTTTGVELDTSALVVAMVRLRRSIERVADDSTRATAESVATETRSTVPRRSGRLAASTQVTTDPGGARVVMAAPYAGWIEHGGTRGRPYSSEGRYLGVAARGADLKLARAAETRLDAAVAAL
jgi:hypothetical protein